MATLFHWLRYQFLIWHWERCIERAKHHIRHCEHEIAQLNSDIGYYEVWAARARISAALQERRIENHV